jgi:hypothetical protein
MMDPKGEMGGPYDAWTVETDQGNVLMLVPATPPDRPANQRVRDAILDRQQATLHGRCPKCDAAYTPGEGSMFHESWCHAVTDRIQRLVKQAGGLEVVYAT